MSAPDRFSMEVLLTFDVSTRFLDDRVRPINLEAQR